jgi:hypothetical protein
MKSVKCVKMAPDMAKWTDETAADQLRQLADSCQRLRGHDRASAQWTRWRMNALAILEQVFGPQSRHYRSFLAIPFGIRGTVLIDPDEMKMDESGQMEGANDFVERKNQETAKAQLETAQGILLAALDELQRSGIGGVFAHGEAGNEASALLRVIKLAERQWRKTIHVKPTREKDVQDAFEHLLIGAELPYGRESETFPFSSKTYRPDFTFQELDLAVELKLCPDEKREKDLMAEINDDILAYSTRYKNILFGIYDLGFIRDVDRFAADFEKRVGVIVRVVKH